MDFQKKIQEIRHGAEGILLGKELQIREVLCAFLAGGNVLLVDVPGTGKTTLAKAFAGLLSLDSRRIQFTPDVMPSDLTGFSVYRPDKGEFVYEEGELFKNLVLADEINRANTKTQSALLEAMEEHQITVEGVTRELPNPFMVIATQNPVGAEGTQALPEAEVDRFMISLSLGFPDEESEISMAKHSSRKQAVDDLTPVISKEEFLEMQDACEKVTITDELYSYIARLVRATRTDESLLRGASPRATLSLVRMAKASAFADERDFVIPSDIMQQFPYVIGHRLTLTREAEESQVSRTEVIERLLSEVKQ